MRRIILWSVLGGITLIVVVVVFQLLGTYWYLKSPTCVVNGAFTRLLDAKSFTLNLQAEDDAKDGLSFNVSGPIDKHVLTAPVADLHFSFQFPARSFSGSGEAKAKDGHVYLNFDQISGISNIAPGALRSIWAALDVNTLLAVAADRLFPETTANFSEGDLQAIVMIAKRHIPFAPTKTGSPVFIDNVLVESYGIVMDRPALLALFSEIKAAVKGSPLDAAEKADLEKTVAGLPPATGEAWVARGDGTLREVLLVFKNKGSSFHIDARFSDYNGTVGVTAPAKYEQLIDLIRILAGTSLSGVKMQLPFDLPVPLLNVGMGVPSVPNPSATNKPGNDLGPLPNLIKLFYGTDQLFQKP